VKNDTADLCIVGAGAAGLAAAIFAGEAANKSGPSNIVLLDGAKSIGAKILVSGGGRCNVTNEVVTPTDFHGNRHIIKNVLAAHSVQDTVKWFASLGVNLKLEGTGKFFPVSNKARTVLDALLTRCHELGVTIHPEHRVTSIACLTEKNSGFEIHHSQGMVHARKVILATGGRSLPRTGSDGIGYEFVGSLGHQVTQTVPALVPLVLGEGMFHGSLSGLSHGVELISIVNGKQVDKRMGSLLWTHFGISGPVVMDASRFWTIACERNEKVDIYGNFLLGRTQEQARQWLIEQAVANPRRLLGKVLAQVVPERFGEALSRHVGCDPMMAIGQLPRKDRDRLIDALSRFRFPVDGQRGWNYAEVTAGGVPLEEVDYRTMESKRVPGLYLIGEILDCDGRIGGFNFQWAWATGLLAGRAAVKNLEPQSGGKTL
jgi:predicted Rossmann fold flavoprotein